ncbi:hypothetical protein T492DRAFT_853226 [Pavlovales sp. CCMP2436]|nr:hypothetical protein T492DRAFT_853226 [Pavlovales sp. CCMP2436]
MRELADASDDELSFAERCDDVQPALGDDEQRIDQTTAAEATHCAPQSQERDIQAARLYIPAADQGDANAQGNSGAFCEYGEGDVLQDFGGAERIWKVTLKLAPASPFSGAAEPEHSVTETRSAAAAEQLAVERKQLGTAAGTRVELHVEPRNELRIMASLEPLRLADALVELPVVGWRAKAAPPARPSSGLAGL